ncbi:osteoclast-stimulating factor 1 [Pelobates cultripes]|uniref:Osteoclast-stimulating factor 1 n=1 Tax=Pelobates cultripes TaxID=61616 RepID=A0AAD1S9N4_PELCU|nr:osteoclast-stimulating factor 1 [Pelobates cultripes]
MSKPPPKPVKPGQVKVFRALYTFEPRTPDELYFDEGDILYISDMSDTNWWKGTCKGKNGLIPSNYVAEQAESIDNPLHEAAKRGNLSWLRECLENRVGVNGLDKAGSTALYWGCHGGHKDVVEVLLSQPSIELNQQMAFYGVCLKKNKQTRSICIFYVKSNIAILKGEFRYRKTNAAFEDQIACNKLSWLEI